MTTPGRNGDGLARRYGALTPRERAGLIVAAAARGDMTEADRLDRSARPVATADYLRDLALLTALAERYGRAVNVLSMAALEARHAAGMAQRMKAHAQRGKCTAAETLDLMTLTLLDHADTLDRHAAGARAGFREVVRETGADPDALETVAGAPDDLDGVEADPEKAADFAAYLRGLLRAADGLPEAGDAA